MANSKNSIELSIPKGQRVRGYMIERMPIGRFLQAGQALQSLPEEVLKQLFPDMGGAEALKRLAALGKDDLQTLFLRALAVLPGYAVQVFSQLSGIDEDKLVNDPAIGLDGLGEMFTAWMEVNGIANFMETAGALRDKVRGLKTMTDGCKG